MRKLHIVAVMLCAVSVPAAAERLHFDHRIYAPLKAVFDENREEMIAFDNSNPRYIVDRIAIKGKSASDWTEALDIIVRVPSRDVKTADDWLSEIQAKMQKACASQFEIIDRDTSSVTFSRRSTNCGADKVQYALYRIVTGPKSLFLLNPISRADIDTITRQQWLELLKSARLEK